jgi:hypothetical protein
MPDLTIEDVPDELCRTFWAIPPERRRLVVSQFLACLENEVRSAPAEGIKRTIERIRERRERDTLKPLMPELVEQAIAEGRP